MTAQKEKAQVLIELLLSEEYRETKQDSSPDFPANAQQKQQIEQEAKKIADICMFRITSLSEYKKIIQQPPKSEESKAGPPSVTAPGIMYDAQKESYILGSSRFRVPN